MKKLIFVFMVFLMTMQVFAVDLWNGFTTDMGMDQVRARTREVLEPKGRVTTLNNFSFRVFERDKRSLNSQFPKADSYMSFQSSLTGLRNATDNVKFYFYRDKLFAVYTEWEARGDDLLPLVQKEYGRHREVVDNSETDYTGRRWPLNIYIWKPTGKIVFLTSHGFGQMYFVDGRSAQFAAEQAREEARKEQERKDAEEARRREAANAVRF